jgi:hypothetical protein
MPDAAEGLVDAEARIQDRLEERAQEQKKSRGAPVKNQEQIRQLQSFRLAKTELERQLVNTTHAVRRDQIAQAMAELDRRIAQLAAVA